MNLGASESDLSFMAQRINRVGCRGPNGLIADRHESDDESDQSGYDENIESNRLAIEKTSKPTIQEIPGHGPGYDIRQKNQPGQIV